MRKLYGGAAGLLLALCLVLPAEAQQGTGLSQPTPSLPAMLTGKERLGRKWMDEQRIDNCNVPVDKRGSKPRSSVCPHVPMG